MRSGETPPAGQAGTIESMDCLVTVTGSDEGRRIEIRGNGASRFRSAMEEKIIRMLDALDGTGTENILVNVQDNGALDLVLGARVEAAYLRYREAASK
ncbi:MAG: citrate lyase acyl carrier protein [Synergistaceae bacterium]|jgi:citrate lyase subunit gamma (acyl carrier protein)|nr:citrate lyase acyl carrier protein [Synergistaceae bacterium]